MTTIERQLIERLGEGISPTKVVRAPGRVNVIGEHTDYNDGFVFPAAIDKYITMAGNLRDDGKLKIYSAQFDEVASFDLANISPDGEHPWANYIAGVCKLIAEHGHSLQGMNLAVTGNIPQGAGLSSSAALEMATAYMVQSLHGFELPSVEIIKLCQRAENQFVGVNCGIMDQFICCQGKKGQALLIDCRSLEATPVPLLKSGFKLVISNTKVKHSLVDSEYNRRRQECEEAVVRLRELIGAPKQALRDVSVAEFEQYGKALPETLRMRAEHVIRENQRVLDGVEALRRGDLAYFGALMYQSHYSLQHEYAVSCPELDLMVLYARQVEGVYGSRMTGGGFGGSTVTLVRTEVVESYITYANDKYVKKTGITPEFYICDVVDGAAVLNPLR